MKYIAYESMDAFYVAASAKLHLYVPVDTAEGKSSYKLWKDGTAVSKALHTTRSAKDFFFPQTENLVEFKVNGKSIEIIDSRTETEDFAIFGVKACDAKSFEILDSVFLADPVDTFYQNRRRFATVVALACHAPEETCFCSAVLGPLFGKCLDGSI